MTLSLSTLALNQLPGLQTDSLFPQLKNGNSLPFQMRNRLTNLELIMAGWSIEFNFSLQRWGN